MCSVLLLRVLFLLHQERAHKLGKTGPSYLFYGDLSFCIVYLETVRNILIKFQKRCLITVISKESSQLSSFINNKIMQIPFQQGTQDQTALRSHFCEWSSLLWDFLVKVKKKINKQLLKETETDLVVKSGSAGQGHWIMF